MVVQIFENNLHLSLFEGREILLRIYFFREFLLQIFPTFLIAARRKNYLFNFFEILTLIIFIFLINLRAIL